MFPLLVRLDLKTYLATRLGSAGQIKHKGFSPTRDTVEKPCGMQVATK